MKTFTARENLGDFHFHCQGKSIIINNTSVGAVSEKVENFHFPYRVKKSVNYRDFHCQGKSIIINNTSVGAEVARQKVF